MANMPRTYIIKDKMAIISRNGKYVAKNPGILTKRLSFSGSLSVIGIDNQTTSPYFYIESFV